MLRPFAKRPKEVKVEHGGTTNETLTAPNAKQVSRPGFFASRSTSDISPGKGSLTLNYARISPASTPPAKLRKPLPSDLNALPRPQSFTEQYWASRALAAETMLSAREYHQRELYELSLREEAKRTVSMAVLPCDLWTNGYERSATCWRQARLVTRAMRNWKSLL